MNRAFAFVTAATALAGIAIAGPAIAQTTLTISAWTPSTHLMTRDVVQRWASDVERVTEGRVKFRMLAQHPSAPAGAFDAVRDGLVDVSFTGPNYTPARHVVTMLPELPGGGTTSLVNSVAYHRVYWKHLAKADEFKGVRLLSTFTHGPGQMFNIKRPIASLADAKGLKFRTGGGIGEKLAQSLGLSSFVKPAPESYELLSSGVADGVFFPLESVPGFKLDTVVKYGTLFPGGIYNVTFAFIMNDAAWDKLSKTDQDLVMSVSGEYLARRAGKLWDAADAAAADQLRKAGVALSEASPELVKDVRARGAHLEQEWIKAVSAKGIDGAAALADFRAEIKKLSEEKQGN